MRDRYCPILAPLDEHQLQNQGLASLNSAEGTRKLHRRRMIRSSNSDNEHIALDVSYSAPNSESAFVTIPTFLISKATLLHVGYTEARASLIWNHWSNWPEGEPQRETDYEDWGMGMSLLEVITGSISRSRDTTSSRDEDWIAAMTGWGIKPEIQEAITDSTFNSIRHSQSCAFWVKDTIKMRYAALEQIQKTSEQRNALLALGRTGDSIEREFRAETQTENARAAAAAGNAPGHTILYKAIDEGRIVNFVQNWDSDYLGMMLSSPPLDFSPTRMLFCFSPQRFVAQCYASWVARRNEDIEARPKAIIIQVSIPNSALDSLPEMEKLSVHFPDDEWKRLIWHSRVRRPLPPTLTKFHDATVIIGTAAIGVYSTF